MPDKIVNHFVLADGSTAKYSAEQLAGDVPEVVGIRTGYDGTVYESAGDAVREQISDINNELTNVVGGTYKKTTSALTVSGEYIETTGAIQSASSWNRSEPIEIVDGTLKTVTITKGSRYSNVAFFTSSTLGTSTFIGMLQERNSVVTPESAISIDVPKSAKYYVLSNNNNNSSFECVLSYTSISDVLETVNYSVYGDIPIRSFSNMDLTNTGYIEPDGDTLSTITSFSYSDAYELNPFVKSVTVYGCGKNGGNVVAFYKNNELSNVSFISGFSAPTVGVTSDNPVTVQVPDGAQYIAFSNKMTAPTVNLNVTMNVYSVPEKIETVGMPIETVLSKTTPVMFDSSATVKFIGDSITAGVGGTGYATTGEIIYGDKRVNEDGHCWANSLKDYLETKYGCTAYNFGVSGINSRQLYDNISSIIHGDENLIVCMIGTNDRQDTVSGNPQTVFNYMSNLSKIKAYCDSLNIQTVFMSSIPASVSNETDGSRHYHMEDIDMACSKFATENNMEYVSVYKLFIEYCKYTGTTIDSYLSDGLHPNDNGYDVMFYLIANALGFSTERPDATW